MLPAGIFAFIGVFGAAMGQPTYSDLVITKSTSLTASEVLHRRIVVKADHIVIDGNGLTLSGPGRQGDVASLEAAGVGVEVVGCTNVTIKNLKAKGFATGLFMKRCKAVVVDGCDFSNNYNNPDWGWGDLPARGGIILEQVDLGVFRGNKANNVWDGLSLTDSNDNLLLDNDFSHCTNTCAKLWTSSRNKLLNNDLSYGIRIDRDKGEVHARDSTSVLIESGSNDNYFYGNNITHGGDGVFIRVLNGWISERNIFVENDTSYANNNCVESWSPGNTYVRNIAERGSYGFWLGGSDHTVLIGNKANFSGLASGYHNAGEPGFGNAGIAIAGFASANTVIAGNETIGNNGAGIAFRGKVPKTGPSFRMFNWILRQNRIEDNKIGIWGRFGDWMYQHGNYFAGNLVDSDIEETLNVSVYLPSEASLRAPYAALTGPTKICVGDEAVFDATASVDPDGKPLTCTWRFGEESAEGALVKKRFAKPGFYRVALNVSNGVLSDMKAIDLVVTERDIAELGTEQEAGKWTGAQAGIDGPLGGLTFGEDQESVVGLSSLRISQSPYKGEAATAILKPAPKAWNLTGKGRLTFWMKAINPNNQGFQGAGPIITLASKGGKVTLQPAEERNLFEWYNPVSEARYHWVRLEIPLAGGSDWKRSVEGQFDLKQVESFSLTMDSYGYDPFTIWLDGLRFE